VFDLAWQDTEMAAIELNGLDSSQLRHVRAIFALMVAEADKILAARPPR
jgi:hypothetical protein